MEEIAQPVQACMGGSERCEERCEEAVEVKEARSSGRMGGCGTYASIWDHLEEEEATTGNIDELLAACRTVSGTANADSGRTVAHRRSNTRSSRTERTRSMATTTSTTQPMSNID